MTLFIVICRFFPHSFCRTTKQASNSTHYFLKGNAICAVLHVQSSIIDKKLQSECLSTRIHCNFVDKSHIKHLSLYFCILYYTTERQYPFHMLIINYVQKVLLPTLLTAKLWQPKYFLCITFQHIFPLW